MRNIKESTLIYIFEGLNDFYEEYKIIPSMSMLAHRLKIESKDTIRRYFVFLTNVGVFGKIGRYFLPKA